MSTYVWNRPKNAKDVFSSEVLFFRRHAGKKIAAIDKHNRLRDTGKVLRIIPLVVLGCVFGM